MRRLLVIGSLNMDMTIFTDRVPARGESLRGHSFLLSPGGKGANQAVAAARLGGDVRMMGRVGDDLFGQTLIDGLREAGIHTDTVWKTPGVSTGVASITVCQGDNSILFDNGANAMLTPADIEANVAHIQAADAVILQLEIPLETVMCAVKLAKAHKKMVFLNPAPATPLPKELFAAVDYLLPNETEAAMLLGKPVDDTAAVEEAIRSFQELGVRTPIITLGSRGVAYAQGRSIMVASCYPVKAVDTTAAGDTFAGGLASAILSGKPLAEAIDFAQRAAAITVTRMGAQRAIPTLAEVQAEVL